MLRDIKHSLGAAYTLLPKVRTADETGTGVDLAGYRAAMIVAMLGAPGDTFGASVATEFQVQESDDNSTYTAVADADLTDPSSEGTTTGVMAYVNADGECSTQYRCGYLGSKRYVRVVENRIGTHSTGTPTAVVVIPGHPLAEPV